MNSSRLHQKQHCFSHRTRASKGARPAGWCPGPASLCTDHHMPGAPQRPPGFPAPRPGPPPAPTKNTNFLQSNYLHGPGRPAESAAPRPAPPRPAPPADRKREALVRVWRVVSGQTGTAASASPHCGTADSRPGLASQQCFRLANVALMDPSTPTVNINLQANIPLYGGQRRGLVRSRTRDLA